MVSEIKETGTARICQVQGESQTPAAHSEWVADPLGVRSFVCLSYSIGGGAG